MHEKNCRQSEKGFSLIELMIVVAIIGILAAIAYPSYTRYVQRSNRSDAKIALMQLSQRLERCYTTFNKYNDPNCSAAAAIGAGAVSDAGYYTITGAFPDTDTYTLTAIPAKAPQTEDTDCPTFTLDNAGIKGPTATAACW